MVLGSLAAFAVHRFTFFGRDTISFALVLPIALPGIVTAIALSSSIDYANSAIGLTPGLLTIIVGHATFCIVVVFNNVVARLRRSPTSLVEASMDLGADGWQTFKYVTFPALRDRPGGRRAAGVRSLVRRDRRDELHGRVHAHAADLDLQQPPASRSSSRW